MHDLASQTYVIGVTVIALLFAVDVPLPIEMTALVMVGLVLRWSLGRQNRESAGADVRMSRLEAKVDHNAEEIDRQRHFKHDFLNQITAVYASIVMLRETAVDRCTCHAFDPYIPVLDALIADMYASIHTPTTPIPWENQ